MDPRIYASTSLVDGGRRVLIRKEGKKTLRKTATGWPQLSNLSAKGRKTHRLCWSYSSLCEISTEWDFFYTLGTTGGGSKLRGVAFGEFDHAALSNHVA